MLRKAAIEGGAARPVSKIHDRPRLARLLDDLTLRGHALALRFDAVPQEFGDAAPVDEADPQALRVEWLRQFRIWSASNPEQLFAIKAGSVLLGGVLLLLLILVAAI